MGLWNQWDEDSRGRRVKTNGRRKGKDSSMEGRTAEGGG